MKNILGILNEIANTSSTKAKEAIIWREENNELLRAVFAAAYNPTINYNIRQIPEYKQTNTDQRGLAAALHELHRFTSREVTGNAASECLAELLGSLDSDDARVLERIIGKDLRCGASDSIASRVWPGFVPSHDVMLCDKDMSRINYPAYAQTKCDGARVHLYFDGNSVKALSRGGKEFQLLGSLDDTCKQFMKPGETFDGELLVFKDGKIADRQTGNGILNKASKGTITKEDADSIVAVIWDIVDFTGKISYKKRFEELGKRRLGARLFLVKSVVVQDETAAMSFFMEQLTNGEEGAIIKNMDSVWVPKRSKDLCKLKEINTADLIVIDWYHGEPGKQFEKGLGGLVCQTSDGKLQVNVGSGFDQETRLAGNFDSWIGKIVEVLYNQKITSKGRETASLFLPRFNLLRFDKDEANTIGELK